MASASNREVMDVTSWKSDSPPQTSSKEATAELEAAKALAGLAHFAVPESGNRGWIEEEGSSQRVKTESPADCSGMIPEASVEDGFGQLALHFPAREFCAWNLHNMIRMNHRPIGLTCYWRNIGYKMQGAKAMGCDNGAQRFAEGSRPSRKSLDVGRTLLSLEGSEESGKFHTKKFKKTMNGGRRFQCVLGQYITTTHQHQCQFHFSATIVAPLPFPLPLHLTTTTTTIIAAVSPAVHDELTRKAASLVQENEDLKTEKKLAVKDYDTLKSTNECLKAEMAKTIKTEVQETKLDSESTNTQIPTSAYANCLFLMYNQSPPAPCSWPSIIQSPNPVPLQNGFQNAIVVPSEVPMSSIANPGSFHEQENSLKIGTPIYILPCPWFFPLPDHRSGLLSRPSFNLNDNLNDQQAGISMNNQNCACLSPKITECEENHQPSLPIKGKIEASCSIGVRPNNVDDEMPFSFPPDGGGQNLEHHHEGVLLLPAPLESTWSASIVKHDIGQQSPDYTPTVQLYPSVSHTGQTLQGMKRDLYIGSSKEKKKAKAAAEARKKRKELVKLKRLHYC
ncbi:hypothetical protein Acr_20g0005540 [Actinidia rufa]|uniref:Basic-leucine zipper (BZIP) transcription factor family protein n=1 Tax=Actinidia rufa TaxID=165716 RepID=A0A7J0GD50_9ERIC|nr:hypothetical protein Acr_20g0005540 [Actinidia rufa]